jgi:hypothetical protein
VVGTALVKRAAYPDPKARDPRLVWSTWSRRAAWPAR